MMESLLTYPQDGIMNLKDSGTDVLHATLKKIANVNNIILKGTFPGMAFLDLKEANEYLGEIHEAYFNEFKERDDAEQYEPNIKKIGTAELIDEV